MMRNRTFGPHQLIALALLALFVAAQMSSRGYLREHSAQSIPFEQRDNMRVPRADALRVLVLNYETFGASLTWISGLIYFGDWRFSADAHTPPQHLIEHGEIVQALDPEFIKIYDWVTATHITGHLLPKQGVPYETLEELRVFLEEGMERHPDVYQLPHLAGLNYLGYSQQRTRAQRIEELGHGIRYFKRCVRLAGCPDNVPTLIGFMERRKQLLESGEVERGLGAQFYLELLETTFDPARRDVIIEQLELLGADPRLIEEASRAGVAEFQRAHEANRPYLPLDAWTLIVYPTEGGLATLAAEPRKEE